MPRPYTRHPCGIYGPRNLVRRHVRRLKRIGDDPPQLLPGQEQLFSFYTPALNAGSYTLNVEQDIESKSTNEKLHLPEPDFHAVTQKFEVIAPRFFLEDGAINSSFPPQGYGALANTLPHVVLSDPHLPWSRLAAPTHSGDNRNRVPWLALLVFTQDELTLPADQLSGEASLFSNTKLGPNVTQSQTLSINIDVDDVINVKSTVSPISALKFHSSDSKTTDVILVRSALFNEIFTSYDATGNPVKQSGPDVDRYKYLAHVRDINTTGMAEAGVEDNGIFGIIVSHRTGPLSNSQPQPVVAHLVSIEGVQSEYMSGERWPVSTPYVAMSTLYSWNFVTLPEGSFNVETALVNLGAHLNVLRAPDAIINSIDTSSPMGAALKKRFLDGYTMTRYRSVTGEVTAALNRGPLTPTQVPYPLMPEQSAKVGTMWLSSSGIDLQIMDPDIGIMDITYSSAWQLGKILAMSDETFSAALGRLRVTIFDGAMNGAKVEILQKIHGYKTKEETVQDLPKTIAMLNELHRSKGLHAPGGNISSRWKRFPDKEPLDLSFTSPAIQKLFNKHANDVARKLMLSTGGDGTHLYDEDNTPVSIDWLIILKWVMDKMYLYSIPAHYLIVDPSFLPSESLRFFHVDRNWTDALVDGALSLGNHFSGTDKVRLAIHGMIRKYLYPDNPSIDPIPNQVPLYGFFIRSNLITQMPDFKCDINLIGVQGTAPILRHDNLDIDKGVSICLLDQLPSVGGKPGLLNVAFTEPPHQQSFIAGAELDSQRIKTAYKKIFTAKGQPATPVSITSYEWKRGAGSSQTLTAQSIDPSLPPHATTVFKWGKETIPEFRTLLPNSWASDVSGVLNWWGNPDKLYVDTVPNAAMVGIQLNNPMYRLVIGTDNHNWAVSFPKVVQSHSSLRGILPIYKSSQKTTMLVPNTSLLSKPFNRSYRSAPRVGSGFELGKGHGTPFSPPPYSRPLRGYQNPRPDHSPKEQTPEVGPPQYTVSCIPIDNDPLHPGIPCGSGIPQDLVFKITQNPESIGADSDGYLLQYFQIQFGLAHGPPDDPSYEWCIMDKYTGPGPFMMSNMRFNIVGSVDIDKRIGNVFTLKVVPRGSSSTDKGYGVPPRMCKEMTFVLPVCRIQGKVIDKAPKGVETWLEPAYQNFQPVRKPYTGLIWLQTPK